MPQCNPGGKFCFGISVVHQDQIQLPPLAVDEYRLGEEANVILSTGEPGNRRVYRVPQRVAGRIFASADS